MKEGLRQHRGPCLWFGALVVLAALLAAGCDEDDHIYDHVPPPGQGTLVVENNTGDDLYLFIDGAEQSRVGSGSDRIVDIDPGLYRVVLSGRYSDRTYREDIDVLEARLSILHVFIDADSLSTYRVRLEIE